jgi:hypothetical protein
MALDAARRRRLGGKLGIKMAALANKDYQALSRWAQGRRSEEYFASAVRELGDKVVLPPRAELDEIEVEELSSAHDTEVRASMHVWTVHGPTKLELVNHLRWDEEISVWWNVDVELRWRDVTTSSEDSGISSTGE